MADPRHLLSVSAFVLLLAAASADTADHFSYKGSSGPSNWGKISPNFSACSNGKYQSPINVVKNQTVLNKKLQPLTRDYHSVNSTLVSNGLSVGIFFEGDAGVMMIQGKNYTLKQMHWHTPSEHQLDEVQYPAELHLFHEAKDGSVAVAAVLYEYGSPDPFLNKIQKQLGLLMQDKCSADEESHIPLGIFNPKNIKRSTRKYYRYTGSKTTPPCSEHVVWSILGKVRKISEEQVKLLKAPLYDECKDNCRPVQSLNGRQVELYDELSQA